jgi:predicted dehydrogenase
MEGEDSAQLLVRFANGVVGSLMTSWAYQPPANTERFSVVGSRGSLHALDGALHLRVRESEEQVFAFEQVDEFAAEIRHFAESIAAGTKPLHSHVEGIQVLELILAAYRSAETGTIAELAAL